MTFNTEFWYSLKEHFQWIAMEFLSHWLASPNNSSNREKLMKHRNLHGIFFSRTSRDFLSRKRRNYVKKWSENLHVFWGAIVFGIFEIAMNIWNLGAIFFVMTLKWSFEICDFTGVVRAKTYLILGPKISRNFPHFSHFLFQLIKNFQNQKILIVHHPLFFLI